jgi:hypothetical protein
MINLVEGQPLKRVATKCYQRVFPYFIGGIAFAGLVGGAYTGSVAWKGALSLLPAIHFSALLFR